MNLFGVFVYPSTVLSCHGNDFRRVSTKGLEIRNITKRAVRKHQFKKDSRSLPVFLHQWNTIIKKYKIPYTSALIWFAVAPTDKARGTNAVHKCRRCSWNSLCIYCVYRPSSALSWQPITYLHTDSHLVFQHSHNVTYNKQCWQAYAFLFQLSYNCVVISLTQTHFLFSPVISPLVLSYQVAER